MKRNYPIRIIWILMFVCTLVISSCGELGKEKGKQIPVKENAEMRGIGVYINAIVPIDDVFEVYYFDPGQDGFSPRDFVFARVKGDTIPQDIFFELPEGVYPERLRLDFGKREDQGLMKLNTIGLYFNQKEYIFSKSEIIMEFKPSKFLEFDTENMTLNTKIVDGRYDPYLYSKKVNNIVNFLLED